MQKRAAFSHFEGKRIIGAFSWFLRRRKVHLADVANAIQASILQHGPDHVALTGDLVNIAAWNEFPAAADWVKKFGPPEKLTFIPGNHDAYVPVPFDKGLGNLIPWMTGDRREPTANGAVFPFVRMRRNIALIGLNSGTPQKFHLAAGTLGTAQIRDLSHTLKNLGQQGFYRAVMIHHPPLPGLAIARKALTDAAELKQVLKQEGCELVLHGHNHTASINWLDTASGPAPVIGVPSASMRGDETHQPAAWNLYHIRRVQGRWTTDITTHRWLNATRTVEKTGDTTTLKPPELAELLQ